MSEALCPLCARTSPTRFRAKGYAVVRCNPCDLERVHPMPDAQTIAAVYAREYFTGRGHGYADYFQRERASNEHKARTRLDLMLAHGLEPNGRTLDVGCADGTFIAHARSQGLSAWGVEHSDEARAATDNSLRPFIARSIDALDPQLEFHAVTLWDVLEHLTDPHAVLTSLRARMTPHAMLGVVVPVIDNITARALPHAWDQYKPPEHLWFFSTRSLEQTLARAGFRVTHTEPAWTRSARVLDAIAHVRARPLRALARLEGRAWELLRARGVISPNALHDSVLVLAQREPEDSSWDGRTLTT